MGQVSEDLRLATATAFTTNPDQSIIDVAMNRLEYRRMAYEYMKTHGETGRLVCATCQKEYITNRPFQKHLALHELATAASTPVLAQS